MAKLSDKIKDDLKTAMINKDEVRLQVLRMLTAAIKEKEIELRKRQGLEKDELVLVIKSEAKKRNDSIQAFRDGGRRDLVDKEKAELDILKNYLPKELNEVEIEKVIKEVILGFKEVGPGDFGRVMGAVMAKLQNKSDGKIVNGLVKKALNK